VAEDRDHNQMWEMHCRGAFEGIERGLSALNNKTDTNGKSIESLRANVRNGINARVDELVRRMDRIEARLWGVLISVFALAGAIIANMFVGN